MDDELAKRIKQIQYDMWADEIYQELYLEDEDVLRTKKRAYDQHEIEEVSEVSADTYVDFSNIDILTGNPKE